MPLHKVLSVCYLHAEPRAYLDMNTKEMKRFLMAAAVILSMLAVSCTKEGAPRFKGNYTFKTSGTVTVSPAGDESAEPQKLKLLDENGQMDVVVSDKNTGEMIVAMNILGGSVLTFNAVADGKTLTITPFSRQLTIPVTDEGSLLETAYPVASVTVSGYAERYADALMFWIEYEGKYTFQDVEYEIVSSDVSCWAKEN